MQQMYKRNQLIFILVILISIVIISLKFFINNSQPFGVTILRVSSNSMVLMSIQKCTIFQIY